MGSALQVRAAATATEQKSSRTPPVRRRQSAIPLRPIAAVVVIMAHVTLLMLLPKLRDRGLSYPYDDRPSILFFLPSIGSEEPATPRGQSQSRAPASHARQDHSRIKRTPEPPAREPESSSAPVAIDWSEAAAAAAGRQVDADEEAARKARAFSAPKAPANLLAAPPAGPKFKWYHARTHRLESIPGGGFMINLNDQCAVVVMIMIVPVCQIGKIEARGDLFQHMDDPTPLGDWDAQLP
jgi:hypothetical protein